MSPVSSGVAGIAQYRATSRLASAAQELVQEKQRLALENAKLQAAWESLTKERCANENKAQLLDKERSTLHHRLAALRENDATKEDISRKLLAVEKMLKEASATKEVLHQQTVELNSRQSKYESLDGELSRKIDEVRRKEEEFNAERQRQEEAFNAERQRHEEALNAERQRHEEALNAERQRQEEELAQFEKAKEDHFSLLREQEAALNHVANHNSEMSRILEARSTDLDVQEGLIMKESFVAGGHIVKKKRKAETGDDDNEDDAKEKAEEKQDERKDDEQN